MPIEINGKVYRNIQEQVKENQDNIADLQEDVDHIQYLIDSGQIGISVAIVEELPTEDINPQCIYMIASDNPDEDNIYYEYMYIDNAWEMIGSTATDLSDYYTKTETDTAITNAKEAFIATYNTTTYNEIKEAYNNGKIPVLFYNNILYVLASVTANNAAFTTQINESAYRVFVSNSNVYTTGSLSLQTQVNKTNTITNNSTDTQYPSAKAVWTLVNEMPVVYWCTYGTTTYQNISEALTADKLPICYYNNRCYVYYNFDGTYYIFTANNLDTHFYIRVNSSNTWSGGNIATQNTSSRINSITSSSSSSQYPSGQAARLLMTPAAMDDAVISAIGEAQFTFTDNVFNASNNKWLGTFTMGNCFFMIPLYGLTQGTTYKTNGTFVYSSLGEVVSTTVNYKITNDTTIKVWSGNSNFTMQEGYTAYLSLLRLF